MVIGYYSYNFELVVFSILFYTVIKERMSAFRYSLNDWIYTSNNFFFFFLYWYLKL